MNRNISEFRESFVAQLSTEYSRGIVDIVADAPKSIVNFNNVAILKKGQQYIRHTDRAFNKAISTLFFRVFKSKGIDCVLAKDRTGRSVYLRDEQCYNHFMPQEKLVGFPKVPWYGEFNRDKNRSIHNTYVALIESTPDSVVFMERLNSKTDSANSFVTIEDFSTSYCGGEFWVELSGALKQIESESQKYKWFDLAEICTTLNRAVFLEKLSEELQTFDYGRELAKCAGSPGPLHGLVNAYIRERGYDLLLSSEDFAISFFTSEWLFNNYFHDDCLEKTYIIAGYLKSIEQLLHYCIGRAGVNSEISIQMNGAFRSVRVESEDFFKATLGNMIHYLRQCESREAFSKKGTHASIKKITKIISKWSMKERNGYFHRHNVNDADRIRSVRDRTILLYCLIIGALH
jgi:hypothetical protein